MPTLRSLVDSGAARLSLGPHPDRARRDAELLMRHLLRRNSAWLLAHDDQEAASLNAEAYDGFVERRRNGEPIQYIVREVEFFGLTLAVTPKVLIPRPETEQLVEKTVERAFGFTRPHILDIGTGSGAIAIAVAHDVSSFASVTATDLSKSALRVARFNARRTGFIDRIRFLQGDLLAPVAGEQFEIVVSNPPYVPTTDRPTLAVEVRDHEPAVALFAGEDGLDIYRRLIPQAFSALVPGGFIVLEIGYNQSDAIAHLLNASGFQQIEFFPDLQQIPRVVTAQHP